MTVRGCDPAASAARCRAALLLCAVSLTACREPERLVRVENDSSEALTEMALVFVGRERTTLALDDLGAGEARDYPLKEAAEAQSVLFSARAGARPVHSVCETEGVAIATATIEILEDLTTTCSVEASEAWY